MSAVTRTSVQGSTLGRKGRKIIVVLETVIVLLAKQTDNGSLGTDIKTPRLKMTQNM